MTSAAHIGAIVTLIALIALCLLWETVLAPLRPGGSWLLLKALPLLVPLFGILRGRTYTYQWTSLLSLVYFCEGAVRVVSDSSPSKTYAAIEVALSIILFASCLTFVRQQRQA